MNIVIASNNTKKRNEIIKILSTLGIEVRSAEETIFIEVTEDGSTFPQNAQKKAEAFVHVNECPALADDSGLSVAELDGQPGVYSARYAGEHATDKDNYEKLLAQLAGKKHRNAYFSCALHLAFPDNTPAITAEANVSGSILTQAQGEQGFGYDPIFFCDDLQKCFALCTTAEKASVSHRGRALRILLAKLK